MLRVRRLVVVLVAAAVAAAGCGGSGGQSPAQATAQITTTWQTFFSKNGSADQIQGMNAQLRQAYKKSTAVLPKSISAQVKSVQLLGGSDCQSNGIPAPCAKVTYDLVENGSAVLSGAQGYAARTGGKWLVSKNTFCALEALGSGGTPPAGC
jgi:hypothetical protein